MLGDYSDQQPTPGAVHGHVGCEMHLSLTDYRSKKSSYEIVCLVDLVDDTACITLVRERLLKREQKKNSQKSGFALSMSFQRCRYESSVSEGVPAFRLRKNEKKTRQNAENTLH